MLGSESTMLNADTTGGLGNDVIYSIMVDRFYNGNRQNDVPNFAFAGDTSYDRHNRYWLYKTFAWNGPGDALRVSPDSYWGGDLQGVIDKLDYLHWLGVTVILLSPVFDNVNGYHYALGGSAYHGYWTKDFFRLDEHYVNPPAPGEGLYEVLSRGVLLQRLIKRAHSYDPPFKIILDVVLNHTSPAPIDTTILDQANYLEMGSLFEDGRLVGAPCRLADGTTCRESFVDEGWFHPPLHWVEWDDPGTFYDGYVNGNLADLDQRSAKVRDYFDRALDKWLALGIDGLRLDSVKTIYPDYLRALEARLRREHPDLILIGEYFDGGIFEKGLGSQSPSRSVRWLKGMRHTTMFNFSFAKAVRAYFTGRMDDLGTPAMIGHILDASSPRNALGQRSHNLVNFINNQDIPRVLSMKHASPDRYVAALKLLFVAPGVPKLFYGDEIGLGYYDGHPHWQHYSRDDPHWSRLFMPWDKFDDPLAREYLGLTRALIRLRKGNAFLKWGETRRLSAANLVNLIDGNSYLAIERRDPSNPDRTALFYFYSARQRDVLEFVVDLPDGEYRSLNGARTVRVREGRLRWRDVKVHESIIIDAAMLSNSGSAPSQSETRRSESIASGSSLPCPTPESAASCVPPR